jgi:hypothetical protein
MTHPLATSGGPTWAAGSIGDVNGLVVGNVAQQAAPLNQLLDAAKEPR